jgi:hypothetical protein
VQYRVYVLSIGGPANANMNYLSSISSAITLTNNFAAAAVNNIAVRDVSDFADGRDLQVSFNKVADETKVAHYRVFVAKAAQAGGFTLHVANVVPSTNYSVVAKTGSNLNTILSQTTKDIQGDIIRNGVAYKVFVLSVSSSGNMNNNALSAASTQLILTVNSSTAPPTNVVATDVRDYGDGRDLQVSYTKAVDEAKVTEYRIFVVKSAVAGGFDLGAANVVPAANYTQVPKTGANIVRNLTNTTRDVQGEVILTGIAYRVFVLAVSSTGYQNSNALSLPSAEIVLSNPSVDVASNVIATDVANYGDGRDIEVSFTKANNEANISYYAVMVVRSSEAGSFNLASANMVSSVNYTTVAKTGSNITTVLPSSTNDVKGAALQSGVGYKVFILSVADGVI